MAATGYTPILIYSSTTASQAPSTANLTNSTLGSELAINITDGKLFYKDNGNVVQVIGWKVVPTTAGGTGLTTYAGGDMLYYASGTVLSKLTIGATGYYISSTGSAPQWSAPAALTKTDDTNVTLTLGGSASTALLNAASLTLGWSGQLATGRGGTGLSTYTAGDLVYYATGTALSKLAIGTAYQVLGVNAGATAPSWQPSPTSVLTAQGDLLYASAANTLARLAKNTTATRYLANTGTNNNPSWDQVNLTNGVTGTLPVANGGTNLTSFVSNGVVHASGTTALTTTSGFTFSGGVLTAGGLTASTGNVTANGYCIAQNGRFYNDGKVVTIAAINTWTNLGVGTTAGLYVFRDGSLGGNAVFVADSSAGAVQIQNGIANFQMRFDGGTSQMQVQVTGGTTPRYVNWVSLVTNLS